MVKSTIMIASAVCFSMASFAQAKPQDTEIYQPVPKVVTPGAIRNDVPADAIILFDGKTWLNGLPQITQIKKLNG